MNLRAVAYLLGIVLLLLAGFLLVPAAVAMGYGEHRPLLAFAISAVITAVAGGALAAGYRGSALSAEGRPDFFRREGIAVVGLAWLVGGLAAALPYLLTGTFDSLVDALFESVSGLTTTGSTVLSPEGIDSMPRAVAFWRSFTHWLGGFGIVMVFVVLFPTGGRSLFRSETPGIAREAGHQRVRDSALSLMRIYVGISALELALLLGAGMGAFDACLHTFGTIATGGFSNHSASVAYFESLPIELIITVFMFLSGVNFAYYDQMWRLGRRAAWRNMAGSSELRAYVGIIVGSSLFIGIVLWFWGGSNGVAGAPPDLPDYRSFGRAMRDSLFQVVSLNTCTGYGTADYDRWPQICRIQLMFLEAVGACAGSTAGGIKIVRALIVAKAALSGVRRFLRPRAIHGVRMDQTTLDEPTVAAVSGYFALWMFAFGGGTLLLSAFGYDLATSATAVVATLNNVGPGLGRVGPMLNFGELHEVVKLVLTLFMILGRLEFYAVVALLVPGFWRR